MSGEKYGLAMSWYEREESKMHERMNHLTWNIVIFLFDDVSEREIEYYWKFFALYLCNSYITHISSSHAREGLQCFFYIFIISQRGSKKNSQNNFFFWLHDMANVWSIWKVDLLRHEKKFFTQSCLFITAKIPHPLTHSFIRFYWIHFVTIINNAGKSFNNSFH